MVGIVIVSHSSEIANGVRDLVQQMSPISSVVSAGGTSDGRLGTDVDKIKSAILEVYSEDGVLILFDLGSAYMNAQMAIEFLDENMQSKVEIVDAALVEGALTAVVDSSIGKTREEIKYNLKPLCINKMPHK
ncbi:dihydroxyacetone kinase phosphoryl donor subunit DhaM [Clostridium sp. Mt-5]|uniref:phosphoenolpyruvate--glycerone phosphotransferase n=1 Tax=Clostridium moutaii TaxID=3240932 RepID=A0ABV4BQF6_9CLOT